MDSGRLLFVLNPCTDYPAVQTNLTALQTASCLGHTTVVEMLLLEPRVDVNIADKVSALTSVILLVAKLLRRTGKLR